jgi:hypothetical protein
MYNNYQQKRNSTYKVKKGETVAWLERSGEANADRSCKHTNYNIIEQYSKQHH